MANSIKSVATSFLTYFGIIERICKFTVIVQLATKNDKCCEHILSQTKLIKEMLVDLHRLELSRTMISAIRKIEVKLKNCDQYMIKMSDRSFVHFILLVSTCNYSICNSTKSCNNCYSLHMYMQSRMWTYS